MQSGLKGGKMKKVKLIVLAAIVFNIAMGLLTPAPAKGKNTYWLMGTSKSSKETGGQLRMYYQKKDSILLKGKAKKSASRNQIDAAKPKKIKAKLKIADTCKITFADEDENVTGYYKDWITNGGGGDYKEGDEMCFTTVNIKVRNKKVVKIIFS